MERPIKIHEGTFYYSKHKVFQNLNIEIPAQKVTCILGESGAGKSTLLKIISGNLELKSGRIENRPACGSYAMAYQDMRLIPHLTAVENIEYVLDSKHSSKTENTKKALFYLEALGLSGFENFLPTELSGGMQRRTGLARALSYPAPLLLLDEAFDSLDKKNKYKVADLFLSIVKKEKRTAVCVTHDAPFAKKIADKIIEL